MRIFCDYGCGQEYKVKLKNGKLCCSRSPNSCPEIRKKLSELATGKVGTWLGRKHTKEDIIKMKKGMEGKPHLKSRGKEKSEEHRKNISMSLVGKPKSEEHKIKIGKSNFGKKRTKDEVEVIRQRMLGGQAAYMNKFVKNPSKPEIMLREIIKSLYEECEYQYQVFNYSLDVALVKEKIAIEYDGYHHFKNKESIEYHKQRQIKIESEGWRFYRVTMFDKFPSKEGIMIEIEKMKGINI